MNNPFSGHRIIRYEVRWRTNSKYEWVCLYGSKTRKEAQAFIRRSSLRGAYLLSRIRRIDDLNHKEDLVESAKAWG